MKLLVIFGLLLSASMAGAVVTKNCPETLEVVLNDFDMNGVIDDNFEPQDVNDFPFDGWNGPGMLKLRKKLATQKEVSAKLELTWSGQAKCHYRGETALGEYASARLEGSLKPGAKEPATMIFYNGSLVVYINLADVKKTGVVAKYNSASLYYAGEYCSWGDCIPNHILIGDSKLKFLK